MATFAAAAVVSPTSLLFLPNPNPSPNSRLARSSRLLSLHRPPSLLRLPLLPPPNPIKISSRRRPSLTISAVSIPSFVLSHPPAAVSSILNYARPLPKLLLASVSSLPARITAAAARAAPTPEQFAAIRALFSAAAVGLPAGEYFKTPLQAVAAGAGSWIGLYSEILSVRVILTWFPNIPWDRQPFSALRNLCDPYLLFFQRIIPPIGGFDISPLLAFSVLGVLSSILNSNPGMP